MSHRIQIVIKRRGGEFVLYSRSGPTDRDGRRCGVRYTKLGADCAAAVENALNVLAPLRAARTKDYDLLSPPAIRSLLSWQEAHFRSVSFGGGFGRVHSDHVIHATTAGYVGRHAVATAHIPVDRGADAIEGLRVSFGVDIRVFEHLDLGCRKKKRFRRAGVKADVTLPNGTDFYFSGPVSALGDLLRSGNISNSKLCFLVREEEGEVLRARANAQLMSERINAAAAATSDEHVPQTRPRSRLV